MDESGCYQCFMSPLVPWYCLSDDSRDTWPTKPMSLVPRGSFFTTNGGIKCLATHSTSNSVVVAHFLCAIQVHVLLLLLQNLLLLLLLLLYDAGHTILFSVDINWQSVWDFLTHYVTTLLLHPIMQLLSPSFTILTSFRWGTILTRAPAVTGMSDFSSWSLCFHVFWLSILVAKDI